MKACEEKEIKNFNNLGEFFNEFIGYASESFLEAGLTEENASKIALSLMAKLCETFRGETFYVSRKPEVFVKQMLMYHDLKTMLPKDVDIKYGVSMGYSLKIKRKIDLWKNQRETLTNARPSLTRLL